MTTQRASPLSKGWPAAFTGNYVPVTWFAWVAGAAAVDAEPAGLRSRVVVEWTPVLTLAAVLALELNYLLPYLPRFLL